MPVLRAARLCPEAVFVPPDFPHYKPLRALHMPFPAAYGPDRAHFAQSGLPGRDREQDRPAHRHSRRPGIRREIREELGLAASAGVAPHEFLAKIAADWRRPDGLFVIQPRTWRLFSPPCPWRASRASAK